MIRMKLSRDEDQQAVKTYVCLTVMTTIFQFDEQAQHFAGMSKNNILKNCINFKLTFRKSGNFNQADIVKIRVFKRRGRPHGEKFCPSTGKKCNSSGKIGLFSIKCRRKLSNNNKKKQLSSYERIALC